MEKKIMKQKSTTVKALGAPIVYTLFLASDRQGNRTYGAAIQNCATGETELVDHITSNPMTAEQLFDALVGGVVTPVCLKEVVEDFIAEN